MKRVKNIDSILHTWVGQEIQPGQYYTIQATEETLWASNSELLSAIGSVKAVMNDGAQDIADVSEAIDFLKGNLPKEVVTQAEKSDKVLRSFCAFTETDLSGLAEFCIQVPEPGRWIAYGDIEFETRSFGDYISAIEVVDHDRLIAWQMALAGDPGATAPLDDAIVQANGFPLYPVIGHYDERSFPATPSPHTKGTIKSGMAMTFVFGVTEAQPVGGYGFIPGGMYLSVKAQKALAVLGQKCQLSIDWAEQV